MSNPPRPRFRAWLLAGAILAILACFSRESRGAGQRRLPESEKRHPRTGPRLSGAAVWPWLFSWAIIFVFAYTSLFDPDGLLGKDNKVDLIFLGIRGYPGQGVVLQFIGAFAIALGLVTRLGVAWSDETVRVLRFELY